MSWNRDWTEILYIREDGAIMYRERLSHPFQVMSINAFLDMWSEIVDEPNEYASDFVGHCKEAYRDVMASGKYHDYIV